MKYIEGRWRMTEITDISRQIWEMKYRRNGADGAQPEESITASYRRVAAALAEPEVDPQYWSAPVFRRACRVQLPAGRAFFYAGAGTERDVTLFYCVVMDAILDDMNGIFESLKEATLTMQQGGGIGYDFSTLHSEKAAVKIVYLLQRGIESVRECHCLPVNR